VCVWSLIDFSQLPAADSALSVLYVQLTRSLRDCQSITCLREVLAETLCTTHPLDYTMLESVSQSVMRSFALCLAGTARIHSFGKPFRPVYVNRLDLCIPTVHLSW